MDKMSFLLVQPSNQTKKKSIDYNQLPESQIIIDFVNKRLSIGLGTNIFSIGLSGSGKSSLCQRLGELIRDSRKVKPNIFLTDSLLQLIDAVRKSSQGDVTIIEEVSVLFPSRRAMSGENVAIGKIFDTIRKKQLCILSNAPIWNTIDSHMKAMGHCLIEALKINKENQIVISKVHILQTNPESGKTYKHTFQKNGLDVSRIYTRMPNLEKWNEYEKTKDVFMDELYKREQARAIKKQKKEDKDLGIANNEFGISGLTDKEKEVHYLINILNERKIDVAKKVNVKPPRITALLKSIREKQRMMEDLKLNSVKMPFKRL